MRIHKNIDVQWILHDAAKNIYCSTSTYTGNVDNPVAHGFFKYNGDCYKLVSYSSYSEISGKPHCSIALRRELLESFL